MLTATSSSEIKSKQVMVSYSFIQSIRWRKVIFQLLRSAEKHLYCLGVKGFHETD